MAEAKKVKVETDKAIERVYAAEIQGRPVVLFPAKDKKELGKMIELLGVFGAKDERLRTIWHGREITTVREASIEETARFWNADAREFARTGQSTGLLIIDPKSFPRTTPQQVGHA